MAVPKKKTSKSKTRKRKAIWLNVSKVTEKFLHNWRSKPVSSNSNDAYGFSVNREKTLDGDLDSTAVTMSSN